MDLRVSFRRVDEFAALAPWRDQHLESLGHSQELFLEVMVAESDYFLVEAEGSAFGYCIVNRARTLIEFFVDRPHWVFGQTVLAQFVAFSGVERAWIKSFDALFLSSAVDDQVQVKTIGLLSRDYIRRELPPDPAANVVLSQATLADLERVERIDQPVFTHPERLRLVIENGNMSLFESEGALVGFGIYRAVIPGRPAVDLGIAIDRPHRNRGYGIYMLQQMMDRCIRQGLVPIGGCAIDNLASRSMAERTGLVARYRLLELTFAGATH